MTSAASRLSRVLAGAAAASALLVPAASAAMAGQAADYFLKIKGVEGDSGKAAAASDKPRIAVLELHSWSFGATQANSGHTGGGMGAGKVSMHDLSAAPGPQAGKVSKVEAITIKQGAAAAEESARPNDRLRSAGPKDGWPAASAGEAEITLKGDAAEQAKKRPGRVKYGDITLKRGVDAAAAGGVSVAAGDLDGDGRADLASPRDAASGQATGKRQHKPMTLTAPLATGSVTLFGRFTGCAVGDRYPELELGGSSGPTYRIADALVTHCAGGSASDSGGRPMESISFTYAKIEY